MAEFAGQLVKRAICRVRDSRYVFIALAAAQLTSEIRTAWRVARSDRKFEALRGRKGLKVNLGCGSHTKEGWLNIDLQFAPMPTKKSSSATDTLLVEHDLRLGLPLQPDCCDLIYSSHFLEHLEYWQGIRLLQDCHRVLRSGGVFRVALPDFRRLFERYIQNDVVYFDLLDRSEIAREVTPGTETIVDCVNYSIYQSGQHKCIYDEEKLILVLRSIGYGRVGASVFREGIDPDSETRRRYSFYVEAIK